MHKPKTARKVLGMVAVLSGVLLLVVLVAPGFFSASKKGYRNSDFPETYISEVYIDLTSPNHWVRLEWGGPNASAQDTGPFNSSPGEGWGTNNCDDPVESNCLNSRCTPKGTRPVEGFRTHLRSNPEARYVTLIDAKRSIGIHRSSEVLSRPSSQGCVRLTEYPARLIYDNSIINKTLVTIDGKWSLPKQDPQETSK